MKLYRYVCTFCGEIINDTEFHGMEQLCGKCKRKAVLINAGEAYLYHKMNNDDLLTPDQLCEWLQVPKSWVYMRTMERGPESLPRLKIGKFLRFEKPAVLAWLKRLFSKANQISTMRTGIAGPSWESRKHSFTQQGLV